MNDLFGISNALLAVAEIYFRSARQSGRTTTLLASVKPGDVVVFASIEQARHFMRQCAERKIEAVSAISVSPERPEDIFNHRTAEGRLIWDHCWLEAHYVRAIDATARRLAHMSEQASGFGEAHIQTALAARERRKWVP